MRSAVVVAMLLVSVPGCIGDSPDQEGPDAGVASGDPDGGVDPGSDAGSSTAPTITVMRGVDRATAFSLNEAKTLANDHGVKWTGVYIGGPCNAGSGWTKSLVASLHTNHSWLFMPVFVGQQSPTIS